MRPDEHKQKKNAAYKKKHGIANNTSDDSRKEGKTQKEKSTGDRKIKIKNELELLTTKSGQAQMKKTNISNNVLLSSTSPVYEQRGGPCASSGVKIGGRSSGSSSSDEEVETSNKKKSFKTYRRREIVSNWQKYELQPDEDEKIFARGENYEKLLSMAGETISHFRFKDELAWDDPADSANENSSDVYSQFVCVNPAELAQSLACLPVHQILGINQDVFPDEQLSSMMNMIKEKRSVYDAEEKDDLNYDDKDVRIEVSQNSRLHTTLEDDKQIDLLSLFSLNIRDHNSALPGTPKQTMVDTTASLAASDAPVNSYIHQNDYPITDNLVKEVFSSDRSNTISKKSDEKLQLTCDDLDAVLDIDNPSDAVAGDIRQTSHKEPIKTSSVPTSDANSITIQSSTAGLDLKLATESLDLEAWLDSILED